MTHIRALAFISSSKNLFSLFQAKKTALRLLTGRYNLHWVKGFTITVNSKMQEIAFRCI